MDYTILFFVEIIAIVAAFIVGKYITGNPNAAETITDITAKLNIIIRYADAFVSWAKQFMSDASGSEKMNEVVKQLSTIAERYNLDITETEIRAIAQKAYDSMIAGEESAKSEKTE